MRKRIQERATHVMNDLGPFLWINRRGFGAEGGVITPTLGWVGAIFMTFER